MTESKQDRDESAGVQFVRLMRDLKEFAGGRLLWVMIAATAAAFAEGAGLLLLVPILGLLGVSGSQGVIGGSLAAWFGFVDLETALAFYVVLVGAAAFIVCGRTLVTGRLRLDYGDNLRERLHRAMLGMEWRSFSRLRGSDLTQVLTGEVAHAAQGVEFVLKLGGWTVQVVVLLTVAARLSPVMTGCVLALAGCVGLLARPLNRRIHRLGGVLRGAGQALQADLADDLGGMRVIRAFGLEPSRQNGFARRMKSARAVQLAFQQAAGTAGAFTKIGAAVAVALALVAATRGFGLPLADTLVLIMALVRLLTTLLGIQDGWRVLLQALPAHASTYAMLERFQRAAEPADQISKPAPLLSESLRLEGVGYHSGGDRPPILTAIDAEIPARRMTALVGPSGAGKTTLADLLLGLTAPTEGCIQVDCVPLQGSLRRDWRRQVGYVPQDGFLFHDTIRANLQIVAPAAGEGTLWKVLDQAAAAGFVSKLPQGLDTVVGDRGTRLSGGERQRLALARALLVEPTLLILDEATSALDDANERQILEALNGLRGQLTMVVIAHRPSTVQGADHVLALNHGRLVAAGSWAEVEASSAWMLMNGRALSEPALSKSVSTVGSTSA